MAFPIGDLCIFQNRCSDWRYFWLFLPPSLGVLRLLIYDKAGGANPKSLDGCNKALAQFDAGAKPQTSASIVVPRDLENEWMRRFLFPLVAGLPAV